MRVLAMNKVHPIHRLPDENLNESYGSGPDDWGVVTRSEQLLNNAPSLFQNIHLGTTRKPMYPDWSLYRIRDDSFDKWIILSGAVLILAGIAVFIWGVWP